MADLPLICSDHEPRVTLDCIARFQKQLGYLRRTETNPNDYCLRAAGFLAELDRMNLEVREYLSTRSSNLPGTV
jgi:hypothetical protein